MLLIADSGSTKCDWALVDSKDRFFSTMGFNPFFHNERVIAAGIRKNKNLIKSATKVQSVFFYGAGCSSVRRNLIVERALQKVFHKAEIHVDHDLTAAAYATYQGKPCISCILGTGSNSCFFDGKKISQANPALAYILGDEGSGSYYGKILLRKFLYHQLPANIHRILAEEYGLTKEKIFKNVYQKPFANVYLASFTKILTQHKKEPFIHDLIAGGMKDFMVNHVCCYKNYEKRKTHFVGSVAYYHQDILRETAGKLKIDIGVIIKKPIENLINYHLKYMAVKTK